MAVFTYKAVARDGKVVDGTLHAPTAGRARSQLLGVYARLLSLQEQHPQLIDATSSSFAPVPGLDFGRLAQATRRLGTALASGVPLSQAVRLLVGETRDARLASAFAGIADAIDGGERPYRAFSQQPEAFGQIYVAVTYSGEVSGNLSGAFLRLADFLEKSSALGKGLMSRAFLPSVIVMFWLLAVGVGAVLISHNLFTWTAAACGLGVLLLLLLVCRVPLVRDRLEVWALGFPVIGPALGRASRAESLYTMALLLEAGVAPAEALAVLRITARDAGLARRLKRAADSLPEEASVSGALSRHEVYGPMVCAMLSKGEDGADLEGAARRAAQMYEAEAERLLGRLASLLLFSGCVLLGVMAGTVSLVVWHLTHR